jgi:hypothetical protein
MARENTLTLLKMLTRKKKTVDSGTACGKTERRMVRQSTRLHKEKS